MSVTGRVPSRGVISSTAAVTPKVDPPWGPPELADPLEAPGGVGTCGSWSGMGRRGADGPRAPAGRRFCAPFVLTAMRPAGVAPGLVEHEARARGPGVGSQTIVTPQSAPQRVTMTEKMSVMASPEWTAVANGWTRSPGRGPASASSSFDVASDRESLVVASVGACKVEPGGEAGGSAAPEEPELESECVSVAGADPVDVPIGSFVVVKESTAASLDSAPEASAELAEGSVAERPSVVSVGTGAGPHVPVVSAAAAEVSVGVAEVAVASGTEAHLLVLSGAAAELSVVVAGVAIVSGVVAAEVSIGFGVVVAEGSIASGAGVPPPAVLAAAADPSAVAAEVSVASGAGALVSVGSAVPELSVVAADVSEVSVGAMPSDDAVAAASLGVESVVIAETSETGGGGSSPRAGAVNRDAQSTAANTATVQPTNPRPRLRPKRGGRIPETAAELSSISASSPWLRPFVRTPSIALDRANRRSLVHFVLAALARACGLGVVLRAEVSRKAAPLNGRVLPGGLHLWTPSKFRRGCRRSPSDGLQGAVQSEFGA